MLVEVEVILNEMWIVLVDGKLRILIKLFIFFICVVVVVSLCREVIVKFMVVFLVLGL